jgi:hypothetical protein
MPAVILLLLAFLLMMNASAIWLRRRVERRWQGRCTLLFPRLRTPQPP